MSLAQNRYKIQVDKLEFDGKWLTRSGRLWDNIFMRGAGNKRLWQFESLQSRSHYICTVFLSCLLAPCRNTVRSVHNLGVAQRAAGAGAARTSLSTALATVLQAQGGLKPVA